MSNYRARFLLSCEIKAATKDEGHKIAEEIAALLKRKWLHDKIVKKTVKLSFSSINNVEKGRVGYQKMKERQTLALSSTTPVSDELKENYLKAAGETVRASGVAWDKIQKVIEQGREPLPYEVNDVDEVLIAPIIQTPKQEKSLADAELRKKLKLAKEKLGMKSKK